MHNVQLVLETHILVIIFSYPNISLNWHHSYLCIQQLFLTLTKKNFFYKIFQKLKINQFYSIDYSLFIFLNLIFPLEIMYLLKIKLVKYDQTSNEDYH